jgi:hypothetical protein
MHKKMFVFFSKLHCSQNRYTALAESNYVTSVVNVQYFAKETRMASRMGGVKECSKAQSGSHLVERGRRMHFPVASIPFEVTVLNPKDAMLQEIA